MTVPAEIQKDPKYQFLVKQGMTQSALKKGLLTRPTLWRDYGSFIHYLPR